MVAWLERHQVPLYLATMVLGAALGLAFPAVTSTWEPAVPPLIAVLLWSTFLGIPLTQLGDGLLELAAAKAELLAELVPAVIRDPR